MLAWLGKGNAQTKETFNAIRRLWDFFAVDRTLFFSTFAHGRNTFRNHEIVLDKL